MQEAELFFVFIEPMNKLGIPYLVTGSLVAMIYGEPRLTHDVDLIVDLKKEQIDDFFDAFSGDRFYVPPKEILKIEAGRKFNGHFNLLDNQTGFKADIYIKGDDKLHEWAFKKSTIERIGQQKMHLAPPEYVIIRKLLFYKEGRSSKHLEDIRNMLANAKEDIDLTELMNKAKEYNLLTIWESITK